MPKLARNALLDGWTCRRWQATMQLHCGAEQKWDSLVILLWLRDPSSLQPQESRFRWTSTQNGVIPHLQHLQNTLSQRENDYTFVPFNIWILFQQGHLLIFSSSSSDLFMEVLFALLHVLFCLECSAKRFRFGH